MSAVRPEAPACSHWIRHWLWDTGDWCRRAQTRRYSIGFRCEQHRPGQPAAQR